MNCGGFDRRVLKSAFEPLSWRALLYAEPTRLCQGGANRVMVVTEIGLPGCSLKLGSWVESWSGFRLRLRLRRDKSPLTFPLSGLPGRSFRPGTGVIWDARLRFQRRRGRLRPRPMVEDEAWWRRWGSVLGERQPLMTGAAGRMVGGGVRSSAGSDETPRPKAASNPRGDS